MDGAEILRIVDAIHRDKDIDKEIIFDSLEQALCSAARRQIAEEDEEPEVVIDRETGVLTARIAGVDIDPEALGRIAALTAKQVLIQKIREAERDVIYEDFENRKSQLVTGLVQRVEPNDTVICALNKVEGILLKREQVAGEVYKPGDRVKLYISSIKKVGQRVKIFVSRTHPRLVASLFELEIPEIQDGIITIKAIAREPGFRTKIAVESSDSKVDCVGACVGVRGARIRNIVDELGGEKIDIVRWNEAPELLINNALKPAEIDTITLDHDNKKATVMVDDDQLSLAIGKRGQNVRLAAKLTGWEVNIVTPSDEHRSPGQAKGEGGKRGLDAILMGPQDPHDPHVPIERGGAAVPAEGGSAPPRERSGDRLDAIMGAPVEAPVEAAAEEAPEPSAEAGADSVR